MALTITIDGSDHTSLIRRAELQLTEVAYGCEVGSGGFDRDDEISAMVTAMKQVVVTESAASPTRVFTGYVSVRNLTRGNLGTVEERRQFDTELLDLNTLWDDPILEGTDANRPAETDYARMTWLIGTSEFGTALSISAGVVPNTNTVNLDARDYRGQHPRAVAEECMEASAKTAFLYNYGAGNLVYYDQPSGTSLSSTAKISTILADVDEASGIYGALAPAMELDPDRIYSTVRFEYANGHVTVTNATTASNYRSRSITISDTTVKTSTGATNKANKYLTRSSTERHRLTVSVNVPAANVNDIRAGQRMQVKLPHLSTAELDLDAFTYRRIIRRTVLPAPGMAGASDVRYLLVLEFDDTPPVSFGGRGGDEGGEPTLTDGSAVTLARYQLSQEIGSGPFGPFAGGWESIAPAFAFGTISAAVNGIVDRSPEGNISWPYTDCGVGTGGVAGLENRSVWHRFTVDLSDGSIVGVRFTIAPFISSGTGYNTSPGGFLVGDDTVVCGIHSGTSSSGAEITDEYDYTEIGRVGDQGGEVFVPSGLLTDVAVGYNWFVLAPGWNISSGLFFCNSAGNKPWGYGLTGNTTGGTNIVSGVEVTLSGNGLSPWVSGVGDVDGTNDTFTLPLWNGNGVPEVRVGTAELTAGEYSYDGSTQTVVIYNPPPADMAGQVAFRFLMGS